MEKTSEFLRLAPEVRNELWKKTAADIERYGNDVGQTAVTPRESNPASLRKELAAFTFETPRDPLAVFDFAVDNLWTNQVHTPHPRYFGLFNPAPTTMGIAADALVAAFNPQMAAWSHNPFAAEVEQHLVRAFGLIFGYERAEGTFCSGGAEANTTAVLCALVSHFPAFAAEGLRALPRQPTLYLSEQAHHSFSKAARCCGLGSNAVRTIPVDEHGRLSPPALQATLEADREQGYEPFLVIATAGATSTGAFDPIREILEIARAQELWFHVDAAWGGAAALLPEMRAVLDGIADSDSITFDAHKFLSVPMGAGLFLTRVGQALEHTFRISTDYMPPPVDDFATVDPYASTMQWSRRFIGLKVFLSLAAAGWEGYRAVIRHQVAMGDLLRTCLRENGWEIVNETPLPLVCFRGAGQEQILAEVLDSGKAWISSVRIPEPALRACVTNYRTEQADIEALAAIVGSPRG